MKQRTIFQWVCKQIQTLKHEWQIKETERFIDTHPTLSQDDKKDLFALLEIKQSLLPQLN